MDIRPIRSANDHAWALREVEAYFLEEPSVGSSEADRFEVLATLIEAYEAKAHPLPVVDPIAILQYAIEEMGRSQADLAEVIGSRSHASEILARKRPLSLEMIRRISTAWDLPPQVLIARYPIEDAA